MRQDRVRRRWGRLFAILVLIPALIALSFGLYLGSLAGELPWQEDPTRIAITPFADLPGSGAGASDETPAAAASPTPDTP